MTRAVLPEPPSAMDRTRGIGGSDAAAILGLSPWKTPLEVYLEKIGERQPQPDTAATYWGRVLEDVVAEEYARRTGARLRRVNRTLAHPRHPIILANLDREIVAHERGPGVLEVKTAARRSDDWGDEGTDEIPEHYLAQVQHYLGVTGRGWADVAVLFLGDRRFAVYHIRRDDELVEALFGEELRFWREHVEPRVPPEPRTIDDIRRRWPRHEAGKVLVAPPDVMEAAEQLAALRAELKALEAREKELLAAIQKAMGDAERLDAPDGRTLATWKAVTGRRLDTGALRRAHPDLARQFERETESRRFLLKVRPENEEEMAA
ncbi:MAG TPA: hypothetical protein ENJ38_08365 [Rhodospirillales bacterium]|nr:hypothetical protein [Rhodospirillales bacterium]